MKNKKKDSKVKKKRITKEATRKKNETKAK